MKIKMIVQDTTKMINGIYFGDGEDSRRYIQLRYFEFAERQCEYVETLREKYEIICRRMKFKELDE